MKQWTSGLNINKRKVHTPREHGRVLLPFRRVSASVTVEAAIVMPLFIYGVTALLFLMQIIMIKQDMNVAMYNTVRTMSKYAYAYDKLMETDKEVSAITAYGTLLAELGTDYAKEHYIVGGNAGLVLLGTQVLSGDGKIEVTITYSIRNPFDIFGIGIVSVRQTYTAQGWLGDKGVADYIKNATEEQTVFITLYGEVYHTEEECAYINLSVTNISVKELESARNLGGGKYYACELCVQDNVTSLGEVYVTNYGDRYHRMYECSGIRRTVIEVPFSKKGERQLCKKCSGVS